MSSGRPKTTVTLPEYQDSGQYLQRGWLINEATVRKLRVLLGPPHVEGLQSPQTMAAMADAASDAGAIMLEISPELTEAEEGPGG